jgi:hypothetical protein
MDWVGCDCCQVGLFPLHENSVALFLTTLITPDLGPFSRDSSMLVHTHRTVHLTATANARYGFEGDACVGEDIPNCQAYTFPPRIGPLLRPARARAIHVLLYLRHSKNLAILRDNRRADALRAKVNNKDIFVHGINAGLSRADCSKPHQQDF